MGRTRANSVGKVACKGEETRKKEPTFCRKSGRTDFSQLWERQRALSGARAPSVDHRASVWDREGAGGGDNRDWSDSTVRSDGGAQGTTLRNIFVEHRSVRFNVTAGCLCLPPKCEYGNCALAGTTICQTIHRYQTIQELVPMRYEECIVAL